MHLRLATFACLSTGALLAVTACSTRDFPQFPPDYREYAYVTNGQSGTVTVLDLVNVRLDREIAVGLNPVAVAASPTRNDVYVVNAGSESAAGSLAILNAETNALVATVPLHKQPSAVAVSATGDVAYVPNTASNTLSVIDLRAHREVAQLAAGQEPVAVRLTPDGNTVLVASRKSGQVSLYDTATKSQRAVFNGCPGASDIVVSPDSSKAFVACSAGHQILSLSLQRQPSKPDQPAAHPDRIEALLDVGRGPQQLALKPDGGELFSMNALADSVSEVITGTNDVNATYLIGANPVRGIVSPNNSMLFVGNQRSQEVAVYAIDDGKRRGSIHVGDGPSALAFNLEGNLLLVADSRSGDVAVLRTATRSLFTILPVGRNPNAIAVKSYSAK